MVQPWRRYLRGLRQGAGMGTGPIELADLERLAAGDSPDLVKAIEAFLEQPDPEWEQALPAGALTVDDFTRMLSQSQRRRSRSRRRAEAREAWQRFLSQTEPPLP